MPSTIGIVASGSSAFSPLSLSPAVWFDASDSTTITEASGKVSEWRDKSGNNRHVSQATAINQPTTGSVTRNGLNVLSLAASQYLTGSVWSPSTTAITIAGVVRNTTDGTGRVAFSLGSNTHMAISMKTEFQSRVGGLLGAVAWLTTTTTYTKNWASLIVRRSGGTNTVRLDGNDLTVVDAGSLTPNSATGFMWVGGDNARQGNYEIAEIVVINGTALSGSNLSDLETYFRTKWATP